MIISVTSVPQVECTCTYNILPYIYFQIYILFQAYLLLSVHIFNRHGVGNRVNGCEVPLIHRTIHVTESFFVKNFAKFRFRPRNNRTTTHSLIMKHVSSRDNCSYSYMVLLLVQLTCPTFNL